MTPIEQAKAYCAGLEAAGVRATWDPRRIVPPSVIIAPPTVTFDTNCGGTGEWKAYALAATSGDASAWGQLDLMVARAVEVLPVENVQPAEYQVDEMASFPAFQMSWSETTEWRTPPNMK